MMSSLFFWKDWAKDYRYTWHVLTALLFFTVAFLWIANINGTGNVVHWDNIQEQKVVETTVHSFKVGPLTLDVPADNYVIFEYLNGSGVTPNVTAYYIFLAVVIASAVVLIAVVSALEGFWFYVGTSLVIFFIAGLRLDVIGVFGFYDKIPVAVVVGLYVLPLLYFNLLKSSTPFVIRLLCFTIITTALALVFAFYSDVAFPMLHLSLTAYTPAMILALLFIIMVAHEVFAFFIYVASQGKSKNLKHLLIISLIYFLNLLITALHAVGFIQWDFIYLNAYVLITLSALLGIWGFRHREVIYRNILPFYPLGAFMFLALGAICFVTIAQLVGNANDPALVVITHTIIYSHTGYGLIFMIYVIANFIQELGTGEQIYDKLYRPTRMPYFTFRFAGTITMLAFFFVSFWQGYLWNGMAGFYNATGDLYSMMGDRAYAQSFYEQGKQQGLLNHRSNYTLGTMHASQFDFTKAIECYEVANLKRPSEFSLVNNGNIYLWELQYFDAIKAYRAGTEKEKGSGPLMNNLAFAYLKVHNVDSALYYMSAAREHQLTKTPAETNFFAMAASEFLPMNADSILQYFETDNPGVTANALVLSTLFRQPSRAAVDPSKYKLLNLHTATLLSNYVIHHAKSLDTTFTRQAYAIASDSLNADYNEALKASLAYAFYHQGNVSKALEILAELVYRSQAYQGKFNYIMGLWALEQGSPLMASSYFTYANTYDYKQAKFYNAIALTEARHPEEALAAWDLLAGGEDAAVRNIAIRMKRILTLPPTALREMNDGERYQFSRYRIPAADSVMFESVINGFENSNYKVQALLDVSARLFEEGSTARAIRYYNRIAGLQITDTTLYNSVRHFELKMLASRRELRLLAQQVNKGIAFGADRFLEKTLYLALLAESNNDMAGAKKAYEILATYNPYFVDGIIAAADFFRKQDEKGMKSYNTLVEAIQVNKSSVRLLKAYYLEARRMGFDDYAASAAETIIALEQSSR